MTPSLLRTRRQSGESREATEDEAGGARSQRGEEIESETAHESFIRLGLRGAGCSGELGFAVSGVLLKKNEETEITWKGDIGKEDFKDRVLGYRRML